MKSFGSDPPSTFPRHTELAVALAEVAGEGRGFCPTVLRDVRVMRSAESFPPTPITYEPSIVIIAQGRKTGRVRGRTFVYDALHYLVLCLPMPFECATMGTSEEPTLGLAVRINPSTVAELLLEMATPPLQGSPHVIDATPITPELSDAAVRLARCLRSPTEAGILGPAIIREMTYRALCGGQGAALQALATPRSVINQIARALKRIHQDFAEPLDVGTLAREAGMSLSTFHANFKAVTTLPPLRYLQTIRLHKAQSLMCSGVRVAEAARLVGYESPSQFSREFKRLFGGTPREVIERSRQVSSIFAF